MQRQVIESELYAKRSEVDQLQQNSDVQGRELESMQQKVTELEGTIEFVDEQRRKE